MDVAKLLQDLSERFGAAANVNAVFGEPRVLDGKTIVPVAAVSFAVGAGGGHGRSEASPSGKPPGEGEGGGGGGNVNIRPIAILELSPEGTRVVPVVDVGRLAFLGTLTVLFMLLLARRRLSGGKK